MCYWSRLTRVGWCILFFFEQKTAYEMRISDWSSDVCSSDLFGAVMVMPRHGHDCPAGEPVGQRRDDRRRILIREHAGHQVDAPRFALELACERKAGVEIMSAVEPAYGSLGDQRGTRPSAKLTPTKSEERHIGEEGVVNI